jgi:photosystem II stability/assembly factor-like uncharacterized protein
MKRLLLVFLLASATAGMAIADCRSGGPQTVSPWQLAVDVDGTLYGVDGVPFRSTDGGAWWTFASERGPETWRIASDPSTAGRLYSSGNSTVSRSDDHGSTWIAISEGLLGLTINDLAVSHDGEVFLATNDGLLRRRPSEPAWTGANLSGSISAVSVGKSVVYASGDSGTFRSSDGAQSWASLPSAPYFSRVAVDSASPSLAWGMNVYEPWRTTDGGATWTIDNEGLPQYDQFFLMVDGARAGVAYVFGRQGLFRKSVADSQWSTWGPSPGTQVVSLAVLRDSAILVSVADQGLSLSSNEGASWRPVSTGLPASCISAVAASPVSGVLYAGVASDSRIDFGSLWRSRDGGTTWQGPTLRDVATITAIAVDPSDPALILIGLSGVYACPGFCPPGGTLGFFRSTDGGVTWQDVSANGITPTFAISLLFDPGRPGHVVAGGMDVEESFDSGATWRSLGLGGYGPSYVTVDPSNSSFLYASTRGGIMKSTDAGATWAGPLIGAYQNPYLLTRVGVDPINPSRLLVGSSTGIYGSTDGGTTWPAHQRADLSVTDIVFDPRHPSTVYAGTNGSAGPLSDVNAPGTYRSDDGGESWNRIGDCGSADGPVVELVLDPRGTEIHAAICGRGVEEIELLEPRRAVAPVSPVPVPPVRPR